MKQILILGGYGRAGKEIADLLAENGQYELITAGRTESKAIQHNEDLQDKFHNGIFRSAVVELSDQNGLAKLISDVDLVIAAVPLNYKTSSNLIDAILNSKRANYIDLSPSQEKCTAFQEKIMEIEKQDRVFILDAGFDPGLPGVMARYGLNSLDQPKSVEIQAIYRDPDIPKAGIEDILKHPQKSKLYKNGMWCKTSFWKMKIVDFPFGFGKALCKPLITDEIKSIPKTHDINEISYYHAGINSVSNLVMLGWQSFLNRIFPLKNGIAWFKWTIKNFTKKPYGGCIQTIVYGKDKVLELLVGHHELYKATAIPIAATTKQIIDNSENRKGVFYMAEYVDNCRFIQDLEKMSMKINKKGR